MRSTSIRSGALLVGLCFIIDGAPVVLAGKVCVALTVAASQDSGWTSCARLPEESSFRWAKTHWDCSAASSSMEECNRFEEMGAFIQTTDRYDVDLFSGCPAGFANTTAAGRASFFEDSLCSDGARTHYQIVECQCAAGDMSCEIGGVGTAILSDFKAGPETAVASDAQVCVQDILAIQEAYTSTYLSNRAESQRNYLNAMSTLLKQKALGESSKAAMLAVTPTEPGCYTRQPNGCPEGKMEANDDWIRDTWGETNQNSGSSQSACEGRKGGHDDWCGNEDSQWMFIDSISGPTPDLTPVQDPPASSENTIVWDSGADKNCGVGSGADSEPGGVTIKDLAACQAHCAATSGCDCITHGNGHCFLRQNCNLRQCHAAGGAWTTFLHKVIWSEIAVNQNEWPSTGNDIFVLPNGTVGGVYAERFMNLLEASLNKIETYARFGGMVSLGKSADNSWTFDNQFYLDGGTGTMNCCRNNCGSDTAFKGYPVLWDADAVTPDWRVPNAAYCELPAMVPTGSHMVRILPCGTEPNNAGVFCALIKVTEGQNPIVKGWGRIIPAPKSESDSTEIQTNLDSACNQPGADCYLEKDVLFARATAGDTVVQKADASIREAIATLRFEVAQHSLGACTCSGGAAATGADCAVPTEKCASCSIGYTLQDDGVCKANICTCKYGAMHWHNEDQQTSSFGATMGTAGCTSDGAASGQYCPESMLTLQDKAYTRRRG